MNYLEKRKWAKLLQGCRYDFLADKLGNAFDGAIIPNELGALLDDYTKKPCLETAVQLIKYELVKRNEDLNNARFLKFFVSEDSMGHEEAYAYVMNEILKDR